MAVCTAPIDKKGLTDARNYGSSPDELRQIFEDDMPRVMRPWKKRKLLLYAHGGLVTQAAAVQRVVEYRKAMLDAEVYPLAFIWNSDYWTTVTNILQDAIRRRRPEGALDAAKDFMLDRLDDALEPLARVLTGKAAWGEMKENALGASLPGHGARLVLEHLTGLLGTFPDLEIHIVGHSVGSILHAPIVQLLTTQGSIASGPLQGEMGLGQKVTTCTLWAPACTMRLFEEAYLPAIEAGSIGRFALFVLGDAVEQNDHCANIYHKSLLYLVSNAFESPARVPLFRDGVALLGMEKFVRASRKTMKLFDAGVADLVVAPNSASQGSPDASGARHHGDFDDDLCTVAATLARIAPAAPTAKAKGRQATEEAAAAPLRFMPSKTSLRARRVAIDASTQIGR